MIDDLKLTNDLICNNQLSEEQIKCVFITIAVSFIKLYNSL